MSNPAYPTGVSERDIDGGVFVCDPCREEFEDERDTVTVSVGKTFENWCKECVEGREDESE